MEKTVFMDFQEYIGVVNELRDETGFGVYISYRMNEPFLLVKDRGFVRLDSFEIFPQMKIIMGSDRDFSFKGKAQIEVDRKDKVGFVRACYGGKTNMLLEQQFLVVINLSLKKLLIVY